MPGKAVDIALCSKMDDLKTLVDRLQYVSAHDSLYLLCNVVTTPRLLYTLRTAPYIGSQVLVEYDELLMTTMSSTLNVDLSDVR